jgi:hypothetical protein
LSAGTLSRVKVASIERGMAAASPSRLAVGVIRDGLRVRRLAELVSPST